MEICDLPTNFKFVTIKNLHLEKSLRRDFNRERMSGEGLVLLAPETTNRQLSQNHKESSKYFSVQVLPVPCFHSASKGLPQAPGDKGVGTAWPPRAPEEGRHCVLIMRVLL